MSTLKSIGILIVTISGFAVVAAGIFTVWVISASAVMIEDLRR